MVLRWTLAGIGLVVATVLITVAVLLPLAPTALRPLTGLLPPGAQDALRPNGFAGCRVGWLPPERVEPCFERLLLGELRTNGPKVAATFDARADRDPFLRDRCHSIMHRVARQYALPLLRTGASLKTVMGSGAGTNCAAGYLHGVLVAASSDVRTEAQAARLARLCRAEMGNLRRASCAHGLGHAFMRSSKGDVLRAWTLCEQLGPRLGPDCGAGPVHEHWEALRESEFRLGATKGHTPGLDGGKLCQQAPENFAAPCWNRTFQGLDGDARVRTGADIVGRCEKVPTTQQESCIVGSSAASVYRMGYDAGRHVAMCTATQMVDMRSCLRGVDTRTNGHAAALRRCEAAPGGPAQQACVSEIAQGIAYAKDGPDGVCATVPAAAQAACREGAARWSDPRPVF